MKRTVLFLLALCLLLPTLAGCSKETHSFDAAAVTAPAEAFPLSRVAGLTLSAPKDFSAEEQGYAWYAPT